jgi:hypothetical protein
VECIGVLIALLAKWYKSAHSDKHRYIGFCISLFVQSYWAYYFICSKLWWLAFYNILNVAFAIRGIKNNKKVENLIFFP